MTVNLYLMLNNIKQHFLCLLKLLYFQQQTKKTDFFRLLKTVISCCTVSFVIIKIFHKPRISTWNRIIKSIIYMRHLPPVLVLHPHRLFLDWAIFEKTMTHFWEKEKHDITYCTELQEIMGFFFFLSFAFFPHLYTNESQKIRILRFHIIWESESEDMLQKINVSRILMFWFGWLWSIDLKMLAFSSHSHQNKDKKGLKYFILCVMNIKYIKVLFF